MPKITDIKEIDGEIWCCVGKPGELESGIAIWTPKEQWKNYTSGYNAGYDDASNGQDRKP